MRRNRSDNHTFVAGRDVIAARGSVESLEAALDSGSVRTRNINSSHSYGWSLLHYVVYSFQNDGLSPDVANGYIFALLMRGCDTSIKNERGKTAGEMDQTGIFPLLRTCHASFRAGCAMIDAKARPEDFEAALDGVAVEDRQINYRPTGYTLLHIVMSRNRKWFGYISNHRAAAYILALLARGCDPSIKSCVGKTAAEMDNTSRFPLLRPGAYTGSGGSGDDQASARVIIAQRAEVQALRARIAELEVPSSTAAAPIDDDARLVAYSELEVATDGFSAAHIIGRGGFGHVFRGTWRGHDVAIKKLDTQSSQGSVEFERELHVFATCRHENLVPLFAFTLGTGVPLCLVYPRMNGGSLCDVLRSNGDQQFSPQARARIAAAIARGLQYLHTAIEGVKPCIVHRDIKSSNVLLDSSSIDSATARLSDVGLARDVDHDTTMTRGFAVGSPGYLDPEYQETLQLTTGSDVFSFGVILLELLTGLPPIDDTEHPPVLYSRLRARLPHDAPALADKRTSFTSKAAIQFSAIAARCIASTAQLRPPLDEICSAFDELREGDPALTPQATSRDCMLCLDRPRGTRLIPCCHNVVCQRCASELVTRRSGCPICRVPITSFQEGSFETTFARPQRPGPLRV